MHLKKYSKSSCFLTKVISIFAADKRRQITNLQYLFTYLIRHLNVDTKDPPRHEPGD